MDIRNSQRGGVVVFTLIGVLLVSLLVGGLYMGKNQARIASENTSAPIAIDTEKDAADDAKNPPTVVTDDESGSVPVATTKPAETPVVSVKPEVSTSPASSASSVALTPGASLPVSGPSSEPLPATGPVDSVLGAFAIATIVFAGFTLFQSSLRLRRSALNN